jgi:hypothetical protein
VPPLVRSIGAAVLQALAAAAAAAAQAAESVKPIADLPQ